MGGRERSGFGLRHRKQENIETIKLYESDKGTAEVVYIHCAIPCHSKRGEKKGRESFPKNYTMSTCARLLRTDSRAYVTYNVFEKTTDLPRTSESRPRQKRKSRYLFKRNRDYHGFKEDRNLQLSVRCLVRSKREGFYSPFSFPLHPSMEKNTERK